MIIEKDFVILKKLLQSLIKKGKKAKAVNFFLATLSRLKKNKDKFTAYEIIYKSLLNARPLLHTQKIRKSSRVFNLPKVLNEEQRINLSLLWFIKSINTRKERTIEHRIEKEFLDCFSGKGLTLTKKRLTYNIILANRPVLHLLAYK